MVLHEILSESGEMRKATQTPASTSSVTRRSQTSRKGFMGPSLVILVLINLYSPNIFCEGRERGSWRAFSAYDHIGLWTHFGQNSSEHPATENDLSRDNYQHYPLKSGNGHLSGISRRSQKSDFDFPDDPDLILTKPKENTEWNNGPCNCWNANAAGHDSSVPQQVDCQCSGSNFTKLHGTIVLPSNVHTLAVEQAKDFTSLSNEDIRPYATVLSELILSDIPDFKEIKSGTFIGMRNLDTIYIHDAPSLREIGDDIFRVFLPKLKIIRISHTGLETAPNLSQLNALEALHMVELENGQISKLIPGSFRNLKTEHLSLGYNRLKEIGPKAFNGSTIARLGLNGNRQLTTLHPEAFLGIQYLRVLDLSETSITYLPTQGLQGLEVLRLENVWTLSVIPSIYNFQNLEKAVLTWPYHCCAFANPETHDPVAYQAYQEYVRATVQEHCSKLSENSPSSTSTPLSTTVAETAPEIHINGHKRLRRSKNQFPTPKTSRQRRKVGVNREKEAINSPLHPTVKHHYAKRGRRDLKDNRDGQEKRSDGGTGDFPQDSFGVLDPNGEMSALGKVWNEEVNPWETGIFGHESQAEFDEENGIFHQSVDPSPMVVTLCGNVTVRKHPKVECHPIPDAFNPCEDIMGSLWLRGAVWVVVALALIGNTAVLVVLLLAPGRMSVQRFLMAHLSVADLCMGLYLLMVATEDLVSLGSYFNYAIDWQLGWGCQIAGFLTVFASELSVFTLAVVTGERWYALTRAIHLTKRLTIMGAARLMSAGWIISVILASLPLIGVSSYSKTSICLPMEVNSAGSVVYLAFLLVFNGLAFLLVATAYFQMYRAVAGHGGGAAAVRGASSADTAIAKKMALLVFTDFACWAPVAFFGTRSYSAIGLTMSHSVFGLTGLTAVSGYPLIGVTDSKILLVFFYPLNSTLNPYLYAIMTKQYRRDLLLLLSRHGICTKRAARYKAGGVSTNHTLQTMQTVLRLGSLTTETKVANPNSPNGGAHVSIGNAAGNVPELNAGPQQPQPEEKNPHQENAKPTPHIFDNPLSPHNNSLSMIKELQSPEEEDNFNNVNGRLLAETSFIRVPADASEVSPSPSCLRKSNNNIGNGKGRHVTLPREDSNPIEDEHDQEQEVSENTPFCSSKNN